MACKWINGEFSQGTKCKETIGQIRKTLHHGGRRRVAKPISDIGSFVNHVYREQNQEADNWANKAHKDGEKLSSIDVISPQCGWRYEASGMEASKTMAEADVAL